MLLGYREWVIIPLSLFLLISFLIGRPHLFVLVLMTLVVTLFWDKVTILIQHAKQLKNKAPEHIVKITVKDLRADALVSIFKPILRISIIQKFQDNIEEKIKSDILRSGSTENPRLLGIKSVMYPIIVAIITVPIGITMFFLYSQAFIGIIFVPIFLFGFYFVTLKIRASDRKTAIEEEMASFATLASIMESVNVSLYSTFVMVAASPSNIFSMMKREGQRIKNVTTLGLSPTDALMDLADSHPSITFRDFLDGYVSSFNTGGSDTSKYLQEQAHRFFKFMQLHMTRYTKQADAIAQIILTIMLLLPMMGLSMMFFSTGETAATMILLMIMAFPFITVILISIIQLKQPKNRESIKTSKIVFLAGLVGGISVYLIRGEIWEAIGTSVVIASFLNMFFVGKSFSQASATESALPEFMRQVTRFKNIGIDIMHAIKNMRSEIIQRREQAKPPKFNKTFDNLIDLLYRGMSAGSTLEQAVAKTKINSWNARLVFFILGKVHESGGGTAKTIDDIARWVTEYADAKKEMIISLRASLMTAFVGPGLMVMMSAVSEQLSQEFQENYDPLKFGNLPVNIAPSAEIGWLSDILTITVVVCMGIVLSKINYFTIKHTMFTGIITLVTMILLYAVPYLPKF